MFEAPPLQRGSHDGDAGQSEPGVVIPGGEEEAERRETERFRDFLEATPDGIVVVDADGRIVAVNSQVEELFGYRRGELIGQPVEILVPEGRRPAHKLHREEFLGQPRKRLMGAGLELRGRRKGGVEFPVDISLAPLEQDGQRFVLAAVRNITERRRAEEKFRMLLESAPDATVIVGTDGRIVMINAQTERLFGYPRAELLGRSVDTLVPDRLRGQHAEHRSGYFSVPRVRPMGAGLDLFGLRRDGTEFPVEISLSPLETEEGTLVSASIRDVSERRQSQEALHRLAAIVESTEDAILAHTPDGMITDWNPAAEHVYGYGADDVVGLPLSVLVPPERTDEITTVLRQAERGERIQSFETPWVRKDGEVLDVSMTVSPMRDASGAVVGAATIARDITRHQRAQEDIRRLATIVESSGEAILTVTGDFRIATWNPAAEAMLGYPAADVAGRHLYLVIPASRRAELQAMAAEMSAGKRVAGRDTVWIRRDGTELAVSLTLSPIADTGGYVAIARDVTERREVEEALRESEDRFRRVFEEGPMGICMVDLDGQVLRANTAFCDMVGYGEEEVTGRSVADFTHPEDVLLDASLIGRGLASDLHGFEIEKRFVRKDGETLWVRVRQSVVRADDGRALYGLKMVEDITETRQVEEAQRELDAHKDSFLRIVSHDLQHPLLAIGELARFVADSSGSLLPDEQREALARIAASANGLQRMVSTFLDVDRLAHGAVQPHPRPTDLADLADRAVAALDTSRHPVVVKADPVVVSVDQDQLGRIIENLVGNVTRHTPAGTSAWIRLQAEAGVVNLTVDDAGPGIPDDLKESIFERFRTGGEGPVGTGIGLWIVARLAEIHGGRAWVEDRSGGGASFRVIISTG